MREELINTFENGGYSVCGIADFADSELNILKLTPDLLVLDINLPYKSGFELLRSLKAKASFPILVLTSRDALSDELRALGLGADDYLTKPCHPDRLLMRAKKLLKVYGRLSGVIEAAGISLDTETNKLVFANEHIILSENEGKVLRLLLEKYPSVVTKQEIFATLWGGSDYVDENILQVNMTRLRKSLSETGLRDIVKTVRGEGYRLEVSGCEK